MWIQNKDKNRIYNLDLCEKIEVEPGEMGRYRLLIYQNGKEYYLGLYNTKDEANKEFQNIVRVIARTDYMITTD